MSKQYSYLKCVLIYLFLSICVCEAIEADPTVIWVQNAQGQNITAFSSIAYSEITPLKLFTNGKVKRWEINPLLPNGLVLKQYPAEIGGTPTEVTEDIIFTITACGTNSSVEIQFLIKIHGCEFGDFLFPEFPVGDGSFILSKDNVLFYNETKKTMTPFCIPQQSYNYIFECKGSPVCEFFIHDNSSFFYYSVFLEPGKVDKGQLETVATKLPVFTMPSLLSLGEDEQFKTYFKIDGIYGLFSISPELPEGITIDPTLCVIKGTSNKALVQSFTITTSNRMGSDSSVFTLAIHACPDGMDSMTLHLRRTIYTQRWKVFNNRNEVLFDQESNYYTNKHMICWTPGSYIFDLSNSESIGWESYSGLNIYDSEGVLAEFTLPSDKQRIRRTFNFDYLFREKSEWKMSKKSVNDRWTQTRFNDRHWEIGKNGSWGFFSENESELFLRKRVTIEALDDYSHLYLDVKRSENCDVQLYVNNQSLSKQMRSRISIPISSLKKSFVIAVKISRAAKAPIHSAIDFDMQSLVVSTGCILQSLWGTASDIQEGFASNNPSNAFKPDSTQVWKANHFPATLQFTFASDSEYVINKVYLGKTKNDQPTGIRIEGVANNSTVVLYSNENPTFLREEQTILFLQNIRAFPTYQIVYLNSTEGSYIGVGDVRFYACTDRICKKRIGYPLSNAGETHFGSCAWLHFGKQRMYCIEDDLIVHWEKDNSACLSTFPSLPSSYLDWVCRLKNMVLSKWERKKDAFRKMLTENLKVSDSEIQIVVVQDCSDDGSVLLEVSVRFTLELEIGDYILKHLKMLDFNQLVGEYLSDKDMHYSGWITSMNLHEGINMSKVIIATVTFGLCSTLFFLFYICFLRTHNNNNKSLYHHKKKDEFERLLFPVCSK